MDLQQVTYVPESDKQRLSEEKAAAYLAMHKRRRLTPEQIALRIEVNQIIIAAIETLPLPEAN